MSSILTLENISFYYEKNSPALKNISLQLGCSEKVAVLGNNGAGKSTFFLCCNGILKPQEGTIYVEGQPLKYNKSQLTALRQKVGLVFQNPDSQLIAGTVEAEVSFGPMNLKLPLAKVKERTFSAIHHMKLEPLLQRPPHYLSGGEKKRVSIADVLAMEPKLLLFDEPTASLDPANTLLLEENLKELSEKGYGLVISTHDVDFAWKWANRILLFHDGCLVGDAPPGEIFSDTKLLAACGLKKPLLYEAGEILGLTPLPKSVEDLKKL